MGKTIKKGLFENDFRKSEKKEKEPKMKPFTKKERI